MYFVPVFPSPYLFFLSELETSTVQTQECVAVNFNSVSNRGKFIFCLVIPHFLCATKGSCFDQEKKVLSNAPKQQLIKLCRRFGRHNKSANKLAANACRIPTRITQAR
jgi:hypothetical protein